MHKGNSPETKAKYAGIQMIQKNVKRMQREVRSVMAKNSKRFVLPKVKKNT